MSRQDQIEHDRGAGYIGRLRGVSARLAVFVMRVVDWFYWPLFRSWLPQQTFRYALCGGGNLVLNWVLYALCYNFLLQRELLDLGFGVVISAHIASFLIVFPITFFTGFWLQRNIAFRSSPLRGGVQLVRYLLSVGGSILLNYLLLKLFVEVVHLYPTPSQMLTSLLTIIYSYLAQKYYTFRGAQA